MLNESYTWRESLTWDLFRRVLLALLALFAFVTIGGFIQTKVQQRAWDDVTDDNGEDIYNMRYSPDFSLIATASLVDGVYIWNARDKTLLDKLGDQGQATQLEFTPENPEFAWSYTNYGFFYSPWFGRMVNTPVKAKSWIYSMALSPGESAVVATGSTAVELWASFLPDQTHHTVVDFGLDASVHALAFSRDTQLLAAGLNDGRVFAWRVGVTNITDFWSEQIWSSAVYSDVIRQVVFSPDKQVLAASEGNTMKLLSVPDGKVLRQLDVPDSTWRFAFSPDSTLLVVPYAERQVSPFDTQDPGFISAWRVDTGEKVWSSERLHSPVVDLQVAQDNKTITAGHFDGEVRTYKMP